MVNTTLKELLQSKMADQYVRTLAELRLDGWQEHVTAQLCKPRHNRSSQAPGSQHILVVADFRATANILSADMKQLERREVMRTMQKAHLIL